MKVKEFTVKNIPLANIKFDTTNPNVVSEEQMKALAKGMKKFGYLAPVILNENMEVLDGEHRVKVYEQLGEKKIPAYVINADKLDGKMLRQIMNKLRGKHDNAKDADEFKIMFEAGKLDTFSKLMAKPTEDFERVLEQKFNMIFEREENEVPTPSNKTKVKVGDIYQLGNHRIKCGSATEDLTDLFDGAKIDLMVTDPPYSVDYASKNEFLNKMDRGNRNQRPIINDALGSEEFSKLMRGFLEKIPFADYSCYYIFMGYVRLKEVLVALTDLEYYNAGLLIWVKNQFVVGRADYNAQHEQILYGWKHHHKFYGGNNNSTVLHADKPRVNELHPTMKPVVLVAQLIKHGSKKGMNVYDAFLGSGSTLIACEETDRKCYGVELEPIYIDVIIKRWESHTGKKAVKIN